MAVSDQLIEREREFWKAAGNPASYEAGFADDGVMAFHVGIMRKPEVVAAMEGAEAWASYTVDDPHVVEITESVASLTYTTVAESAAGEEYVAAISSVYALRDGIWTLMLHHQTPQATG